MKRIFICILVICFILCGCGQQKEKIQKPVSFYYPVSTVAFNTATGVIDQEIRESAGFTSTDELLCAYLKGPNSQHLSCPFPANTEIVSVKKLNSTCNVVLSEQFAELTGLDLTIACHSLGMTVMALTGASNVEIRANNAELDGQKYITVSRDNFLLIDNSTGETVPPQQ